MANPTEPVPAPAPATPSPRHLERPQRPPTDGKAVVALSLAIFGLTGALCGFGLVFGAPAVVLALLALRDIRRSDGRVGGRAVATAAAALGITASSLFFVWLAVVSMIYFGPRGVAIVIPPSMGPSGPSWPAREPGAGPQVPATTPVELHRAGGPLATQLAREATAAEAAGDAVLVETTAVDCEACDEVENAMLDPQTRGALEHVRVVGVDVGEFHSELGRLRMDESTAPWFYLLDARGEPRDAISAEEWGDNEASEIAPVLRAFVRGGLRSRKHRWHGGTTL